MKNPKRRRFFSPNFRWKTGGFEKFHADACVKRGRAPSVTEVHDEYDGRRVGHRWSGEQSRAVSDETACISPARVEVSQGVASVARMRKWKNEPTAVWAVSARGCNRVAPNVAW